MTIRFLSGLYLCYFSSKKELYKHIKHITGFSPLNMICYEQALRHHSASATIHQNGSRDSNERLEYLGDSVLNTIVAQLLFNRFPFKDEGFLTEMRSKIVSRESLNELAIKIGLNHIVMYDKRAINNHNKNSIFGNALEAFIGAVFLDAGFYTARTFILEKLLSHIDIDKLQHTETNFKGRLIEWAQRNSKQVEFENTEEMDRKQKIYKVRVLLDRVLMGEAENLSKKKAEQMASQKALEMLSVSAT